MKPPKHLGILGGMGPVSTAHFYKLVLEGARARGAKRDVDFPRISLVSARIPGFYADRVEDRSLFTETILGATRELALLSPEIIVVPCNTAHSLVPNIASITGSMTLNMPLLVLESVRLKGLQNVAVLGTQTTADDGIYQHAHLENIPLTNDEQAMVIRLIERGEEGQHDTSDTEALGALAHSLSVRGAEAIILGCTELSTITLPVAPIPFFDSSAILAKAAVEACYA